MVSLSVSPSTFSSRFWSSPLALLSEESSLLSAGSLPLSLRNVIDDVGDYEQFHPELYSIANYFELYVLSSTGKDREFYQIFNKNEHI